MGVLFSTEHIGYNESHALLALEAVTDEALEAARVGLTPEQPLLEWKHHLRLAYITTITPSIQQSRLPYNIHSHNHTNNIFRFRKKIS
jgi:hypothetical protein